MDGLQGGLLDELSLDDDADVRTELLDNFEHMRREKDRRTPGHEAGQQIAYPDEEPEIRQKFEAELAKRGMVSDIPEEAYTNRDYQWDYGDDGD